MSVTGLQRIDTRSCGGDCKSPRQHVSFQCPGPHLPASGAPQARSHPDRATSRQQQGKYLLADGVGARRRRLRWTDGCWPHRAAAAAAVSWQLCHMLLCGRLRCLGLRFGASCSGCHSICSLAGLICLRNARCLPRLPRCSLTPRSMLLLRGLSAGNAGLIMRRRHRRRRRQAPHQLRRQLTAERPAAAAHNRCGLRAICRLQRLAVPCSIHGPSACCSFHLVPL